MIIRKIKSFIEKNKRNVELQKKNVTLMSGSVYSKDTYFERNNLVHENVNIIDSHIGKGSYIGRNSYLPKTKIGKYTSIGRDVKAVLGHHPYNEYISTHPSFYSVCNGSNFSFVDSEFYKCYKYVDEEGKYCIEIGHDVWIGNSVLIMEGVTIGDGAIIGAGAVVTKDIEPYSICVGVPAKKIKNRFSEDQISFLLEYKWWCKEEKWLKENCELFRNPPAFFDLITGHQEV